MYFWKIKKLNEELISGELSESEQFKYLVASSIFLSFAMIEYYEPNKIDTWSGVLSGVIALAGLFFMYHCNGGSNGQHFLQRYISISWVLLVRMFALVMLPSMVILLIIQELYLGGISDETTITDVIYTSSLELIYVLWVAKHINGVARESHG